MADDVVDLIMQDHREVERLFDRLRKEPDQRPMLVPVVSQLLIAHSRAEEAEVYPVARDEGDLADDVEHSQEEHVQAEEILERLRRMDHNSEQFDEALEELIDAVTHHVEEEEDSVLPGMRDNLPAQRLRELADAFIESRAEHMGELPGEATRDEIELQAENAGISARSSMSKDELTGKLRQRAHEEEDED